MLINAKIGMPNNSSYQKSFTTIISFNAYYVPAAKLNFLSEFPNLDAQFALVNASTLEKQLPHKMIHFIIIRIVHIREFVY